MHIYEEERHYLRDLATIVNNVFANPVIVNIGVAAQYGYCSMYCLRAGGQRAHLIGVDIEDQGLVPDDLMPAEFIIGDSNVIGLGFSFPIHLLFVDGDHSEEAVSRDITSWTPKVVPGGIVSFHDYGHYGIPGLEHTYGVKLAVDKLMGPCWQPLAMRVGSLKTFVRRS